MKSPLAAIKLHAQTLEQEGIAPEARQRVWCNPAVGGTDGPAGRQRPREGLIARKRLLALVPVALGRFFKSYFAEARPMVERRGVAFAGEVEPRRRCGQREGLRRVMSDLVENAVRFSRGGSAAMSSTPAPPSRSRWKTTASAFPGRRWKDLRTVLPDRPRERSPARRHGRGLAIVTALVREIVSRCAPVLEEGPRTGSRFVIELPVAPGCDRGTAGRGARMRPPEPARILVVEDEEAITQGLPVQPRTQRAFGRARKQRARGAGAGCAPGATTLIA